MDECAADDNTYANDVEEEVADEDAAPRHPEDGKNATQKTRRRRFKRRPVHEIAHLKSQVEQLEAQIPNTSSDVAPTEEVSFWQSTANVERAAVQTARLSNNALRNAVHERTLFFAEMETLLLKKPRVDPELLGDPATEFYHRYHLPDGDIRRRVRAMHAILNGEYRHVTRVLGDAGLLDAEEDTFWVKFKPQANDVVVAEAVEHLVLAAPFDVVTNAVWRVFGGDHCEPLLDGFVESVEWIDECLLYSSMVTSQRGRDCHANILYKKYPEPDRNVIVVRSVLHDPQRPTASNALVENVVGWVQISALPDNPDACRMTMLLQVDSGQPDPMDPSQLSDLAKLVETISVAQRPAVRGRFPDAPAGTVACETTLPVPTWREILPRGVRFERTFKAAVNAAVHDFNTTKDAMRDGATTTATT
ncbi:Aste57867_23722 [Aphanomyces stellatus]|uniref:Aste57867_23722 protein n=1 Tax=Aphanomyces stellatus TaxID=120398 RepID=A0A485LQA9_9STRA|nr:hypothetical protein As57867_023650 [Aphanomyces stellatus]VFU00367.1 Aste57867_23722 [Aphanomyces stellatus]